MPVADVAPALAPPIAPDQALAPPAPAPAPAPRAALPGILSTLGRSLDLCVAASGELRRASLYIGLLTLATVGPFATVIIAFATAQGGFDWLADAVLGIPPNLRPVDPAVPGLLWLTALIAVSGYVVVSIEGSVMAAAILAGRTVGRSLTMREALRRSRQSFWRVVRASFLVGLLLAIPSIVLNLALAEVLGAQSEAATIASSVFGAIVGAPFAYVVTGIVLGDVDASESVRRSTRLARARWRLAIAISSVGAVVAYIQLFAFGAGVDILSRVGTMLDVGFDSGVGGTLALTAVVLVGVLSVGSLALTLAALIVAPQVVAFFGLTAYGAGIDRAREGSATSPTAVPWVTVPMGIVIVVGILAGLAGVASLL